MQKIMLFSKKAAIFLPSILIMAMLGRWIGLAVAALNPIKAFNYITQKEQVANYKEVENPFKDFILPKAETNVTNAPQENPDALNPNYSVSQEFFTSTENSLVFKKDNCYIKNMTYYSDEEVRQVALSPIGFSVEKNSTEPQVLIVHTHATESYLPSYDEPFDEKYAFRNTDTEKNMVAVGAVMAQKLNELGINTIQDKTLHDYPSYNGSYDNSKATVERYLNEYPSIKIVLDVHRDAAERDGTIVSPIVDINGEQCAQIMIISGADNGKLNMPNFWENLKFSSLVQNTAQKMYPGLMRPVLFDYRNYNQQLSTGSILVEVGTHGATLEQAKRSAALFATALAMAMESTA